MKPAINVSAWEADDGSLYHTKEEAELRNRRLEFRKHYNEYQLYSESLEMCLPADDLFHWLENFPHFHWTFTIPPTEETPK